jgi:hypothetical protein
MGVVKIQIFPMTQLISAAQWVKRLKVSIFGGPTKKSVKSNLIFGGQKNC